MAFSPFARFRNFTLDNLKALLEAYPDMAADYSWGEAGDLIEAESHGYKKTAYQQACQFGIEDRGTNHFRIQSYLYTLNDAKLKEFLVFWLKTYYAPNPYVNSEDDAFIIYCELAKEILASEALEVDYYSFFNSRIGGKSDDILMNAIKAFAHPIQYRKDDDNGKHYFFVKPEDKALLENEVAFIESDYSVPEKNDRASFFERYCYKSFCHFYGRSSDLIKEVGVPIDAKTTDIKESYTLEEFGSILREMYDNAETGMQVCSIHVFGIKYGKVIIKEGFKPSAIIKAAGLNDSYYTELTKALNIYKALEGDLFGISFDKSYKPNPDANRKTGAENILLYGVPGAGKSYTIQRDYCANPQFVERVVFHPDYTYSDFVGQILPRVENGLLKYVFTPGPFTKALKKAYEDPGEFYYLVIEELNRGNAPAIFGEIFQLLDRKDASKYPAAFVGESEYAISNYDVASVVYGDADISVRIPSNLFILATMNTSDQNVFTLDTAFQRRWLMRHIENDVSKATHAKTAIEGSTIDWGTFASVINQHVLKVNEGLASSEDKRLGAYFVTEKELVPSRFPEKVLKYLWDDAFKMDHDYIFNPGMDSLDMVITTYEKATGEDRLGTVLRASIYSEMLSKMSSKTPAEHAEASEADAASSDSVSSEE